jgi:Uma2 family endonuclease
MMLEEFLSWDPGDPSGRTWQLIDGEPVAMVPGNETHSAMQSEIGGLLGNHLIEQQSQCRVLTRPGVVPRVHADRNFRVPDLGITCAPPSQSLMMREPLLLIEILSPSNEAGTRSSIWTYATIPSVQEILAVHSTRIEAELYRRNADGTWPAEPVIVAADGVLTLASVAFSAPLASFYRTTALAVL